MNMGEKLRAARLEAGLSQKALCGDQITRNMLSQIENGSARPSMKTLQYLASQLGKPVSFFLEEELTASPNQAHILDARRCFDLGDWAQCLEALGRYQAPDLFDREWELLKALSLLALAEDALKAHREPYVRQLLRQMPDCPAYCGRELNRRKSLLLGALGEPVSERLPSLDEELLLRAGEEADPIRKAALLDAAQERSARWFLLRGGVSMEQEDYKEAASYLQLAEAAFPKETVPQLEICFRELGDYEKAYFYACKRRG